MIGIATTFKGLRSVDWLACRAVIAVFGLAGVGGCAQVGPNASSVQQPATNEQELRRKVDYAGSSAANGDVSIVVLRTLLAGDQGYFPKTKEWAEYIFELKTFNSPISIQSAAIVTKDGAPLLLARSGSELLEAPNASQEFAKNNAVLGGAATGAVVLGAASIPFIGPLLMLGASTYNAGSAVSSIDNELAYDKAFREKSGLNLSHLEPNARLVLSVFFPLVPDARSVVIDYKKGVGFAESGRLVVPFRQAAASGSVPVNADSENVRSQTSAGGLVAGTTQSITANAGMSMTVKQAQEALKRLGYSVGTPDGVAGRRTEDALRRFQKDMGLSVTGKLDSETAAALSKK